MTYFCKYARDNKLPLGLTRYLTQKTNPNFIVDSIRRPSWLSVATGNYLDTLNVNTLPPPPPPTSSVRQSVSCSRIGYSLIDFSMRSFPIGLPNPKQVWLYRRPNDKPPISQQHLNAHWWTTEQLLKPLSKWVPEYCWHAKINSMLIILTPRHHDRDEVQSWAKNLGLLVTSQCQ